MGAYSAQTFFFAGTLLMVLMLTALLVMCRSTRNWSYLDHDRSSIDGGSEYRRAVCSVLGPLHTVHRAELWEVVLDIQAGRSVHVGVDNLNVVRRFGRICDEVDPTKLSILMEEGELLALISEMVQKRDKDMSRVTKVKGHATEDMERFRQVRGDDRLGNKMADEVAELGRRRVDLFLIIDASRDFSGVCW